MDMKLDTIGKATYVGDSESQTFINYFQAQVLAALHKRGILTDRQLEKGLSLLKERNG